jgi:hypothetical protein
MSTMTFGGVKYVDCPAGRSLETTASAVTALA